MGGYLSNPQQQQPNNDNVELFSQQPMEHDPSDIIMFRPPKETLNMIKDMTSIVSDSKVGKEINKSIDDLLNKDTSITSYSFTPQTKEWGKPYYSGKKKYDYR